MSAVGLLSCLIVLEAGLFLLGRAYLGLQESGNRRGSDGADYTIMCFGESMTINAYPELLEKTLNRRFAPRRFSVIDKGMSSSDSDYIVSILNESLRTHRPDMVIVMTGINDAKDPVLYSDYMRGDKLSFLRRLRVYRLVRFLLIDLRRKTDESSPLFADSVLAPMAQTAGNGTGGAVRNVDEVFSRIVALLDAGDKERAYELYLESYKPFARPDDLVRHFKVLIYKLLSLMARHEECEALAREVLEKYPGNRDAHACLVDSLCSLGKYKEGTEFYNGLIERADSPVPYVMLSTLLMHNSDFSAAEKILLKGFKHGFASELKDRIFELYRLQGRFDDYRTFALKMYRIGAMSMDQFCGAMAFCAREQGREDEEKKYTNILRTYGANYVHPKTARNLNYIARTVLGRGAVLVFMQYPMRDVKGLKKMLPDFEGRVFFVDNEEVFRTAVREHGFRAVFRDNFAGDFGHLTSDLGDRLLVENIIGQLMSGPLRFLSEKEH